MLLVLLFIIASAIYHVIIYIFWPQLSFTDFLAKLQHGDVDVILPFSWYVFAILLFYSFFYYSFKFKISKHYEIPISQLISVTLLIVLYYTCIQLLDFPSYWNLTSFCFLLVCGFHNIKTE